MSSFQSTGVECKVVARVLANGTYGTCCSVLVSFEEFEDEEVDAVKGLDGSVKRIFGRYLFNVGEGTQRLCAQYRIKSAKISSVLLTRLDSQHCGGLGGFQFSLADAGSPNLSVRGPEGVCDVMSANSAFIYRRWPETSVQSVQSDSCHKAKYEQLGLAQVLSITLGVELKVSECTDKSYCHWCTIDKRDNESSDGSSEESESSSEESDSSSEESDSSSGEEDSEEEKGNHVDDVALCFILRCWSRLHYNGKTPIKSKAREIIFAVVDCPSEHHIRYLTNSTHFVPGKPCAHEIKVMFHFAPKEVVVDSQYQQWLKSFTETRHILVHPSNFKQRSCLADPFPSSTRWTSSLRVAVPGLFPETNVERTAIRVVGGGQDQAFAKGFLSKGSVVCVEDRLLFGVCFQPDDPEPIHLETSAMYSREKQVLLNADAVKMARNAFAEDSNMLDVSDDESLEDDTAKRRRVENVAQVTFLGTGSAKPSKLRGCSAVLVSFGDGTHALMDVGEGVYGQMTRLYGKDGTLNIIKRLRWVWISHNHLDHHGGVGRILDLYSHGFQVGCQPLLVIAPAKIKAYLETYVKSLGKHRALQTYTFYHCSEVWRCIDGAKSCRVIHCHDSFAFAFPVTVEEKPLKKVWLVYSGDTRPCPSMWHRLRMPPDAGMYTILIHGK
uniref:ribonuclease Z n=1 Tax=Mucochytrium quahogii TaxID=96639 RepID=A0A7S2RSI5_9STRA|mmetsp:Transcript_19468/g.42134  ORF Transcript_19468/g.42134 Transcript_19468/m.42134 type:complete len:666 (+) Transcript_19468:190-2187(+)